MIPTIELAAVAASALYGILRGLRDGFDIVGLLCVGAATAFGGGTLRDLFLDRTPLFWVEHEYLLWVVFGLAAVSAVTPRMVARIEPYLIWPDALGLGLFSVAGAAVAVNEGMSPLIAAVMGVITGTFGSVICDVICNETPNIFRTSPLCATCALLGAIVYLTGESLAIPATISQPLAITAAATLRLLAVWRKWIVPVRLLESVEPA
ncbi:trimeric intracellular cation channel family protein [Botrimarina mediterranea]|uniref:Glycine transporter domain-containing protein n=1 Tax=Botrimarina mediterranea TaxID=2528022 RepID=A0A518KCZ4_9BACT|nr:trimeric intracellular cation channel family protein [Botrimarina mediterranea]QDV75657.1 hypothetical protein Spa11_38770 [Botrimarina mediterranea]QDV80293.1 hypothetical protein K2D_39190 [Planctomycetes bacterium K2D]